MPNNLYVRVRTHGLIPTTTFSDGNYEIAVEDVEARTVPEFIDRLRSIARDAAATCKLTRLARSIPSTIHPKTHTVPCSQVLAADGQMRSLADVFSEVESFLEKRKQLRASDPARLSGLGALLAAKAEYSGHTRQAAGGVTSCSMPGADGVTYRVSAPGGPSDFSVEGVWRFFAEVAADPQLRCTVTKTANAARGERARSVQVPGALLFGADGSRRPINEVFDESCRGPSPSKTVFQPPAAPWRLCLRLEEPPADSAARTWSLRVFLQAADDPSLLVALDEAKRFHERVYPGGHTLVYEGAELNGRRPFDIQRYGRTLGEAAGRIPILRRLVGDTWRHGGRPGGDVPECLPLSLPEAVEFLRDAAPQLEEAGFGVLLPEHLRGGSGRSRLSVVGRVAADQVQPGGLGVDSVLRFDWELALGDDVLTAAELRSIVQLKMPLVRVRGKWAFFSADEMQQMAQLLEDGSPQRKPVGELLRLVSCGDAVAGLPVSDLAASGAAADLWEKLHGRRDVPEEPLPDGLRATLRPYQRRGYSWLTYMARLGLGACLADDMGLGKTVQALAFLLRRWESGHRRPNLLVCPTSVIGNWRKEAGQFAPGMAVRLHHGESRSLEPAGFFEGVRSQCLVISSYNLLSRDADLLRSVAWGAVVLDEAQNVKNPRTRQAVAAKRLSSECRVALTGTPVENSVRDLWSIMDFLNPGYFGTWAQFERRYFDPIHKGRDPAVAAHLQRAVRPFLRRRVKTDRSVIADLPQKLEANVYCTLTPEQATLYEAVLKDRESGLGGLAGGDRRNRVLGLIVRLKQVCNHPMQFIQDRYRDLDRSGKLARLTEMVEEVTSSDQAALVFTQYHAMGDILQRHLSNVLGTDVLFLHGGVAREVRERLVERFQGGGPRVFVLSLRAGGTGLNLTRANHVFHYDHWWNPAVEDQATDRAFRIGQTRNVHVHRLICVGTLEERIDRLVQGKREVAGQVVGSVDDQLAGLSDAELHEFLRLGDDAVAE